MLNNPYVKNIFSALAIIFFGFILLNLTFLFNFCIQSIIGHIFWANIEMSNQWLSPMLHLIFTLNYCLNFMVCL